MQATYIAKMRGAYLRFGDGDVFLLTGLNEAYQSADSHLAIEMQQAFALHGPGIMKCLMIHTAQFGLWPGMAPGIHEVEDATARHLLSNTYKYFIGNVIYSPVALPYAAVFQPQLAIEFLKFLKTSNPVLFVGNRDIPDEIVCRLFGPIPRVPTPSSNSFTEIARIEADIQSVLDSHSKRFGIIITAMGCSGRPLAKRIYSQGYNVFIFDFGSLLDAFCGWNTRTWIRIAPTDVRWLLNEI
jgi:hypothetical protein